MNAIDLNSIFRNFLSGQNFLDWANVITEQLIEESGQSDYSFYIKKILPLLKVKKVSFVNSFINGYVSVDVDGFSIYLSEKFKHTALTYSEIPQKYNNQVARYKLAHEVSHLLFYDINSCPPKNLINLSHGSPELEYACNVLARCLILPRNLVTRYVENFFKKRNNVNPNEYNLFYLPLSLMSQFDASWKNVLTRIFDDLKIISNCVFMEFSPSQICDNEKLISQNTYRLNWIKVSSNLTKTGLFIPYPKNEKVNISVKGVLVEVISKLVSMKSNCNQRGVFEVNLTDTSFKGFGNIDKFLIKRYNRTNFIMPIYYLFSKKSIYLALCFDDINLERNISSQ